MKQRIISFIAPALSTLSIAFAAQAPSQAIQPYIFSSSITNLAANVPSGTSGTGVLNGSFDFTLPSTVSNWNVIVDGTVALGDLPDFTFTPGNSNLFTQPRLPQAPHQERQAT